MPPTSVLPFLLAAAFALPAHGATSDGPAPRSCVRRAGFEILEGDGSLRCRGLPFTVRFPTDGLVKRAEGKYVTLWALDVQDGRAVLMLVRPFPAGARGDTRAYLDRVANELLGFPMFSKVAADTATDLQAPGVDAARTVPFRAVKNELPITGQVRAYVMESYLVVLLGGGPKGSAFARGEPRASAYFDSLAAVPGEVGSGRLWLVNGGASMELPALTWRLFDEDRPVPTPGNNLNFQVADPEGSLSVQALPFGPGCSEVVDETAGVIAEGLTLLTPRLTRADFQPLMLANGRALIARRSHVQHSPRGQWDVLVTCAGETVVTLHMMSMEGGDTPGALLRRMAESAVSQGDPPVHVPEYVRKGGRLRVAMSGDHWPLHAGSGAARFGVEAELARELGRRFGLAPTFVTPLRGRTPLDLVAAGEAEVALSSITPTPEGRRQVDFTEPYAMISYRVAMPKGGKPPVTVVDLRGARLAVPRGVAAETIKRRLPKSVVVAVADVHGAVDAVARKRADFAVADEVALVPPAAGKLQLADVLVTGSPLAMAVKKGTAAEFTAALRAASNRVAYLTELLLADLYAPTTPEDGKSADVVMKIQAPPEAGALEGGWIVVGLRPDGAAEVTEASSPENALPPLRWHAFSPDAPATLPHELDPQGLFDLSVPATRVKEGGAIWAQLPSGVRVRVEDRLLDDRCGDPRDDSGDEAGEAAGPSCPTHGIDVVTRFGGKERRRTVATFFAETVP